MKKEFIKFDVDYLKYPFVHVENKKGYQVEIIKTDKKGDYPLVGIMRSVDNENSEEAATFTSEGLYDTCNSIPEKSLKMYVNRAERGDYVKVYEGKRFLYYGIATDSNPMGHSFNLLKRVKEDGSLEDACNMCGCNYDFQPTTDEERAMIDKVLRGNGLFYNTETKNVEVIFTEGTIVKCGGMIGIFRYKKDSHYDYHLAYDYEKERFLWGGIFPNSQLVKPTDKEIEDFTKRMHNEGYVFNDGAVTKKTTEFSDMSLRELVSMRSRLDTEISERLRALSPQERYEIVDLIFENSDALLQAHLSAVLPKIK